VAAFEQVCQAVGYAHAHNVIHRDLKPSNLMVGAFGEVQVMDWGLAKVLTARGRAGGPPDTALDTAAGTAIRPAWDADQETQAGSLLGTPAFMPPEQAIGAVDRIDARSDVFSLGGILCAVLTGRPPAMPTALAPAVFASWPTSDPTGPLAAATTTVSPGAGLPITRRPLYAVNPGIPSTSSPVVTGATAGSSLRRSPRSDSACVRHPVRASTMSPSE
jgi:serine/threonine protein kinase